MPFRGIVSVVARCVVGAVLVSAFTAAAYGQSNAAENPKPIQSDPSLALQALTEKLSAPSYATRKEAMVESWRAYEQSRDAVWDLLKSDEAETAARARWILDRWEIGLMADLPPQVQRELSRAKVEPSTVLALLVDGGFLREAVEVVRHHSTDPTNDRMSAEIERAVATLYPELILQGLRKDRLPQVLEMLDLCARSDWLVGCRAILLKQLGHTLTVDNVLPRSTASLPLEKREELAAKALAVAGEFELAFQLAEQAGRADLTSALALMMGDWNSLAEVAEQSTEPTMPIEVTLLQYATWLVCAEEAGLTEQANEAAAALQSVESIAALRWRALLISGRIEAAITIAKESDPAAAADILIGQQRLSDAFAVMGLDPVEPLEDVLRIIDEDFGPPESPSGATGAAAQRGTRRPSTDRILATIRLLRAAGANVEIEQALRYLGTIGDPDPNSWTGARVAAFLAWRYGMRELVAEILAPIGSPVTPEVGYSMGNIFLSGEPEVFQSIAQAIASMRPSIHPRDHWNTAMQLVSGELPFDWDVQTDLEDLFDQTIHAEIPGLMRTNVAPSFALGDIFSSLGRGDLAGRVYLEAARGADPEALSKYADHLYERGDAELALKMYRSAYERVIRPNRLYRSRSLRSRFLLRPSARGILAGEAASLEALGRTDEAEQIWQALDLMPLQPSILSGSDYLDRLERLGQLQRRIDSAPYELRMLTFYRDNAGSDFYSKCLEMANDLSETDQADAARWWKQALIGSLAHDVLYANGYLHVVAQTRILEGLAAIHAGERSAGEALLLESLEFYPLNIDMGEDQLVDLRDRGEEAIADRVLAQVLENGANYIAENPRDANALNNLAWVAARNGRHYDRALAWSRRAVFLEPDSTSYRDTLAEVLFRMGRVDAAIEVEQQCLRDEPDDWHLHEQIQRFSQSK